MDEKGRIVRFPALGLGERTLYDDTVQRRTVDASQSIDALKPNDSSTMRQMCAWMRLKFLLVERHRLFF